MAKIEEKIFGKIVRVLRASNFLTLKAAGAKANICTSAFYNFETELRTPKYNKQIKIAEAFRIPKELFDELWNLTKGLNEILNENYHIEERMMLEGEIIRKDGETERIPEALNEIGISKNIIGVMRFDVLVNEKIINSYTANGILVCTPTGSTAYNLSCGGPIVDPTAQILTLTPIAPHTVINRSIVLSDDSIVKIKITELRDNTTSFVLYDDLPIEVFNEDAVIIRKSDKITKIIKLENRSFIDTIRENIN